uniref:Endoribonuclease Dicer homolog 1 n=1 Tax=Cannabis sativa TaxID=3483 RepID=A0A803NSH9_CANSA
MEDEARVPGNSVRSEEVKPPSYWLDACEDISCDLIGDLVDFTDASVLPDCSSVPDRHGTSTNCNQEDFFGGIDHILDSFKNGDGLPLISDVISTDDASRSCTPKESLLLLQNGGGVTSPVSKAELLGLQNNIQNGNGLDANKLVVNGNGEQNEKRGAEGDERCSKKARIGRNERYGSGRGQFHIRDRERERCPSRKRTRDWDDVDKRDRDRDRDSFRRKEHYNNNNNRRDGRERDLRDREVKGYWERDKSGSNDLVFRHGAYEVDREAKVVIDKSQDSNGKEESKSEETKEKIPEEQVRQYQLDVLEQAKKKNTIAFLETGAGKTLIAVLLIKSLSCDMQKQNKKMLAIFLVPKVPLVYQQAEAIRERTGYQVGHYCGEMGQDFWDARRWQREFESKQQREKTICIWDDCFSVNLKGVSSQVDCAIKIRNLESKLDSTVCTIKDRKELEKYVPMPSERVVEYDKAATLWSLHEQIKQLEVEVEEAAKSSSRRSKWQFMGARDAGAKEELRQVYGVSERTESDGAVNLIQKLRAVNYALGELGQWCAYKVAQSFLAALQNDERANYQLDVKFQESYLSKRSDEIEEGELLTIHAVSGGEHVDVIIGAAVADGKVTPKVQSLIKVLLSYQHTDDFRAIIFVERVVSALVLPKVTLLVATSVAEEGLDIRQCNVVIRFDLAKTVLAYIQSRVVLESTGRLYIDVREVESTGAVVSLNSAVGLIHFYCSQLPSDRYSILRPEFVMVRHEKPGGPTEYSCKLQLPCNAPFETLEGPICSSMRLAQQAVCLAACKKLHEMGAFTDMLLPDKGSGEEKKRLTRGEWILSGKEVCNNPKLHLFMYDVKCVNAGYSKDPFLTRVSDFALLFGNELDAEVLSMSMDLFIARTMTTKASLVFRGSIDITQSQLASLKSFHVRLMSIVLDVDVEPSTTPWDPAKAYLFVPVVSDKSVDPIKEIDWDQVEKIIGTDAWGNPLQRARPDVYLGTNERTLGGDRREYGFGKLRHGMAFGQKSHPTYGIRGAVAQFDVVKASGLVPDRGAVEMQRHVDPSPKGKLIMADTSTSAEDLIGRIVTAAHSGKRFYVDSICYDMTAENSFPRKEGYLGPLEYSSYAHYYKQKYGVELMYKQQPLIRGRGVSYCKNLLSPRFEHAEGESDESVDKTYYVFLPPELCLLHPLPGSLVRGAQRLPSIMRRVESMLLAVQLKHMINYPVPASKILEALTAASCQETFCYERAELLGDAYLKWVVSRFLFLKYPQKHEGQLTRMRQQMVSNFVLYQYALSKGLQSYIQADSFSPSRWAAPGVLPVFDEDTKDGESSLFDQGRSSNKNTHEKNQPWDELEDDVMEDGELEGDSSSYRVLSSKTLADVVEALIGVYYVQGGKYAANHLMKWIGIEVEFDPDQIDCPGKPSNIPETVLRNVNFDALEGALNIKFRDRGLLVEAITHASRPSSGVSCYQRLEFVGDAVLDHLITKHLFFTYTNLPPGRLTDLRAAAVNNENFARVAVRRNLHVHLRHGSSALEKQIRDFVKEVQVEFSRPGFNSFGLGDCKAPKVLGDIVESIAGAIFLDAGRQTAVVWKVFEPLLDPMVTPETLPMHPVRELQERCQQQAEGLEYKATRNGNLATVEVFVDGIQVGIAQNAQKKMAQKLAARNALVALKEKESAEAKEKEDENGKKKNGAQTFTRQTLNDICLRRNWPMPFYRCVNEGGPAHAKRFTFAVRVNTTDKGWTDECVGEPMPSVKKAKDSAAVLLLELLNKLYS